MAFSDSSGRRIQIPLFNSPINSKHTYNLRAKSLSLALTLLLQYVKVLEGKAPHTDMSWWLRLKERTFSFPAANFLLRSDHFSCCVGRPGRLEDPYRKVLSMSPQTHSTVRTVNTVLGQIDATELGVTACHETLLSVYPGAQHAPDITLDRAEIFATLAAKLRDFRDHGGNTIVDASGMYHGRDVNLYQALSKATGVHIIASTGMGPEYKLGGYFLTPQTNPPTPWPAEKFEALFSAEITDGMVIPRIERRGQAGIVTALADQHGMTATERGLFQGAARSAKETGVGLSVRFGAKVLADLDVALSEGIAANRILVGDMDRTDAVEHIRAVAERGAFVGLDHLGLNDDPGYVDDTRRIALLQELVEAGFANKIIASSSAVGVAKGHDANERSYSGVLSTFMPHAISCGLSEADAIRITTNNPRDFLAGPVN